LKTAPLPRLAPTPIPPKPLARFVDNRRQLCTIDAWELESLARQLKKQADEIRRVARQSPGFQPLTLPEKYRGVSIASIRHILADYALAARKAVREAKGGDA